MYITNLVFLLFQTKIVNILKSEQYITYVISNINKNINGLFPLFKFLPKELLISKT